MAQKEKCVTREPSGHNWWLYQAQPEMTREDRDPGEQDQAPNAMLRFGFIG
jgi:hypothetical protein